MEIIKMKNFYPQNEISVKLLRSIPIKFVNFLDAIGQKQLVDVPGNHGDITWNITSSGGAIRNITTDIEVCWLGSASNPTDIFGNDIRFENIQNNLDFFIRVETGIYDELKAVCDEL